jgi:hypothetical protein
MPDNQTSYNDAIKEMTQSMAIPREFYEVYTYGDRLHPGLALKIERSIAFREDKADISHLLATPEETLRRMREESATDEQIVYEKILEKTSEWVIQAAHTLILDQVLGYLRTPPVKHSSNQWEEITHGVHVMSNRVYKMEYSVCQGAQRDHLGQQPVPEAWYLTWHVFTNPPGSGQGIKIAGQNRKCFTGKVEMEKYLAGRIKAYAHLFSEITPPIPRDCARCFRVNGILLPGYTVQD